MNSLEEIALKVAKECEAVRYVTHGNQTETISFRLDQFEEFARRLVAALGAQPAVSREYQGRDGKWYPFIGEWHYKNTVADGTWPIRELFAAPVLPSVPEGWIDGAIAALTSLTTAKEYKESVGKDSIYEVMRAAAWQQAYKVLAAAPSPQEDAK